MSVAQLVVLDALTDLVDTARTRAQTSEDHGDTRRARALLDIATTLDRARTILVEDGDDYLDTAWAFVDAGRRTLARMASRPLAIPA